MRSSLENLLVAVQKVFDGVELIYADRLRLWICLCGFHSTLISSLRAILDSHNVEKRNVR